jgi:WD40 repeat protein
LLGCDDCSIILYDAKEMKSSWELNPFKQSSNLKIQCVKCGPSDSTFVCSLVSKDNNKLLLYDVKTKKIEVSLQFLLIIFMYIKLSKIYFYRDNSYWEMMM